MGSVDHIFSTNKIELQSCYVDPRNYLLVRISRVSLKSLQPSIILLDNGQTAISNIISEIKKFETSDNIETIQESQENVRKIEETMNKKANKQEMN